MKEEFVPYDIAEELFKIGCIVDALGYYTSDNFGIVGTKVRLGQPEMKHQKKFDAILYQQAFRWLRKEYKLEMVRISPLSVINYYLAKDKEAIEESGKILFITGDYIEEAELSCLRKLIEIAKDK